MGHFGMNSAITNRVQFFMKSIRDLIFVRFAYSQIADMQLRSESEIRYEVVVNEETGLTRFISKSDLFFGKRDWRNLVLVGNPDHIRSCEKFAKRPA